MSKFFKKLTSEKLFDDWANILDWLFDDNRFSEDKNWDRSKIALFTKRVKKLSGLSEDNFQHKPKNQIDFAKYINTKNKPAIYIILAKQESIGRDLIRHIRNGVAHGNTVIHRIKGEMFIEICDYISKNRIQTAYIHMPMNYIIQIYKTYSDIEQSISKKRHS